MEQQILLWFTHRRVDAPKCSEHARDLFIHTFLVITQSLSIQREKKQKKWNFDSYWHRALPSPEPSQSGVFICDGWRSIRVFVREQSTIKESDSERRRRRKKRQKPINDLNHESHGEPNWKKEILSYSSMCRVSVCVRSRVGFDLLDNNVQRRAQELLWNALRSLNQHRTWREKKTLRIS